MTELMWKAIQYFEANNNWTLILTSYYVVLMDKSVLIKQRELVDD